MKILVVDDDKSFADKQIEWLAAKHFDAIAAYSEMEARVILRKSGNEMSIALIDMYMETKESGLNLIRLIGEKYPSIVPIVITGHGDLNNAAKCMEEGSFSYVVKGETPSDLILQLIMKAQDHQVLLSGVPRLKAGYRSILGQYQEVKREYSELDAQMSKLFTIIQRFDDENMYLERQRKNLKR